MHFAVLLRGYPTQGKGQLQVTLVTVSHSRHVRSQQERQRLTKGRLRTRHMRLIHVNFQDSTSRFREVIFSQVRIRHTIMTVRPIPPSVINYQGVSFRLQGTNTSRQSRKRAYSSHFVYVRRLFLCRAAR